MRLVKIQTCALFLLILILCPIEILLASSPVQVKEVQIEIYGDKTKKKAVIRRLQVLPDTEFPSETDLKNAVDRDVQELINLRIFNTVSGKTYPIPGSENEYQVTYTIEDAITFVPIPMVLYNSNSGLQLLYIQIWDNAMGSLMNWFSIASLTLKTDDSGSVVTGPWLFSPQLSNIRLGNTDLTVKLEQERVESSRFDDNDIQLSYYRYDRTALSLEWEWRFGSKRSWYYNLRPGLEFRYGYTDFIQKQGYSETSFLYEAFHSIYFDNVDNYYNSRRGLRTGITNTLRMINPDRKWKPVLDFTAEIGYYMAFGKNGRWSYYPRFSAIKVFNDTYEKLGESVRGIPDATMDGNLAFYLNQTIGIGIWQWKKVWDLQIHPWFDMGIALNGSRGFSGWQDIRKSIGADILLFIERIPNLIFRFSWGVDLSKQLAWGEENKTEFIVQYSYTY